MPKHSQYTLKIQKWKKHNRTPLNSSTIIKTCIYTISTLSNYSFTEILAHIVNIKRVLKTWYDCDSRKINRKFYIFYIVNKQKIALKKHFHIINFQITHRCLFEMFSIHTRSWLWFVSCHSFKVHMPHHFSAQHKQSWTMNLLYCNLSLKVSPYVSLPFYL